MTTMSPETWLGFLDEEYLSNFIRAGGASVKFAVPLNDHARSDTLGGVRGQAHGAGYLVLDVSAADTRVHMIDQIFHRLAEQVPWQALCRRRLEQLANEAAFQLPDPSDERPFAEALAAANDLEVSFVLQQARPWIEKAVFKNADLARDFRVAMTNLMSAELNGGPEGRTTSELIVAWLTGTNKAVSAVKTYGVRSRITRTNARYFLESLLHWVRACGWAGTVIVLDLERLAAARNPRDGLNYYTKAALLDAYEVLRQFIDSTDRLASCLLTVVPAPEFLETETPRGMGGYEALMFRVYDEVRDRDLVNPMASLIRLGSAT